MRLLALLAVIAHVAPANAGDDALATVNALINESDQAAGLHSIDMFSYKLIGGTDEIHADAQCIHMTRYLDRSKTKSRPLCYEHRDIARLVIVPLAKTRYNANYFGDFQVMLHYRQMSRLAIVGVSEQNLERFVAAVRNLAPRLKKIKYISTSPGVCSEPENRCGANIPVRQSHP